MNLSILITGSGKGLGYAVTRKHLEAGDQVFALEYQITDQLLQLKKDFLSSLVIKQCDLGSTEEVEQSMRELVLHREPLDIVYNIAGIFFDGDRVPLENTDIDRCSILFNVNTLGPLRVLKNAIPLLKEGTVVMNVTSESGSVTDCHRTEEYGYSMSKSALNIASKTLSNQMADKGIRVFCYHPGWLKTDMGGVGARLSSTSLTADEAADAIMDITLQPDSVPADVMYLDYARRALPW